MQSTFCSHVGSSWLRKGSLGHNFGSLGGCTKFNMVPETLTLRLHLFLASHSEVKMKKLNHENIKDQVPNDGKLFSVFIITFFGNSGPTVGNTPPMPHPTLPIPHTPTPRVVLRCFFDSEKMTFLDFFDIYFVIFDIISQYFAICVTIRPLCVSLFAHCLPTVCLLFAYYLPTICSLFLTPMLKITSHD